MIAKATDWIAATSLRLFEPSATTTRFPISVVNEPDLSWAAGVLYGELLSYLGHPMDPYDGATENHGELRTAIQELIEQGLAVRLERA